MSQPQLRPIITSSRPERDSSLPHASFVSGPFCLSPCSEEPEDTRGLTFTKLALAPARAPSAPSSVFAGTSTDSEAQSTNEGYCSPAARLPRSPSLLSSMFASQPPSGTISSAATSRNGSTSGACSTALATPLSPLSPVSSYAQPLPLPSHIAFACAPTTQDCKPILRRTVPAPCTSTSTSTSASEDNGHVASRGYRSATTNVNGLGLALSGTEGAQAQAQVGQGKKCALKFAVKPCFPQGSFARSSSANTGCYDSIRSGTGPSRPHAQRHRSRSPDPIPEWEEVRTPGLESSEDEDDGYEEDEEGGFTSDEDELSAFAAQARPRQHKFAWTTSSRHCIGTGGGGNGRSSSASAAGSALTFGLATPRRRTAVETYCTTDDNAAEPMRGRKISIAAKSTDKCSRHLSPPPRSPSPEYAPPAARSPSARDLCMRRARVMSERAEESCAGETRGWKSDGAFFGSVQASSQAQAQAYGSVARAYTAPLAMGNDYAAETQHGDSIGDQVQWQARKASLPNPPSSVSGTITCKSILRSTDPLALPAPPFMSRTSSRVASPRAGVTPLSSAASSPRSATGSGAGYRLPVQTPLSPISSRCGLVDQSCALAGRAMCGDVNARDGLELALNRNAMGSAQGGGGGRKASLT